MHQICQKTWTGIQKILCHDDLSIETGCLCELDSHVYFQYFSLRDFRVKYLKQGPHRIGKKYKKAVFTQYKDGTFKERAEDKKRKKELGILGPVIRAQIRDVIKVHLSHYYIFSCYFSVKGKQTF